MTQEPTTNDEDATPTFEDALMRLADAVRQLEEGNLSLDESLSRYEEGIRHLSQCQKILTSAERKIEVLSGFDADGNPVTQSFDDEVMTLEEKADTRSRRRTANPTAKRSKPAKKSAKKPASSAKVTKANNQVAEDEATGDSPRTPSAKRRPANRTSGASQSGPQDDVDAGGTLF